MTIGKAIRDVMKKRGVTQIEMRDKLGYKAQSAVAKMLRSDMQVSNAIRMLDIVGYEIIIQPKSTRGKRATGSYVITKEDEQEEE
jgi:hypothetical protein|nr:MAG TPA: octamer-binding transcription factor 1 [Caudoviricetes sp.]